MNIIDLFFIQVKNESRSSDIFHGEADSAHVTLGVSELVADSESLDRKGEIGTNHWHKPSKN